MRHCSFPEQRVLLCDVCTDRDGGPTQRLTNRIDDNIPPPIGPKLCVEPGTVKFLSKSTVKLLILRQKLKNNAILRD